MEEGQTRKPESEKKATLEQVFFSGHVKRVKYDDQDMTVTFDNGAVYHYKNVPRSIVDGLCTAESRGTYINQFVKGKYPYERIG